MTDSLDFVGALKQATPPWLRRTRGAQLLGAIGDVVNTLRDRTATGVLARFPGATTVYDALAYVGRDRRIIRGLGESTASYELRLQRWLDDHKYRGGPYALLEQIRAYYAGTTPRRVDLVYEDGTRFILGTDGTITRDTITWRELSDHTKWAQAWLFVWYPTSPSVTYDEAQSIISIAREWTAGHVAQMPIFGISTLYGVWDYPPDELWDDDGAALWDAHLPIDFYGVT